MPGRSGARFIRLGVDVSRGLRDRSHGYSSPSRICFASSTFAARRLADVALPCAPPLPSSGERATGGHPDESEKSHSNDELHVASPYGEPYRGCSDNPQLPWFPEILLPGRFLCRDGADLTRRRQGYFFPFFFLSALPSPSVPAAGG